MEGGRAGHGIRTIKHQVKLRWQWLKHVVLATWEAEIGRIMVPGQPSLGI
jgi:hypothetical protein